MLAEEEGIEDPQLGSEKKLYIEKWLTTVQPRDATSTESSEKDTCASGDHKKNKMYNTFKNMFKKRPKKSTGCESWVSTVTSEHSFSEPEGKLVIMSTLDTGQLISSRPRIIYKATKTEELARPTRGYSELVAKLPSSLVTEFDPLIRHKQESFGVSISQDNDWQIIESSETSSRSSTDILTSSQSYLRKIELVKKHIENIPKKPQSQRRLRISESRSSWRTSQGRLGVPLMSRISRVSVLNVNSWTRELTGAPYLREQDRALWQGRNREIWFRFNTLVQRHKNSFLETIKARSSSASELSILKNGTHVVPAPVHMDSLDSGVQTREENSSQEKAVRTAVWHAAVNRVRENMAIIGGTTSTSKRRRHDLPLPSKPPPSRPLPKPRPPMGCPVSARIDPSLSYGYNNLPRVPFNARFKQVK